MSSAPAQPWAVVSTNQPATENEPLPGTVAPALGTSMKPSYELSRTAPGPGCQPLDCAHADGMSTAKAANVAATSATDRSCPIRMQEQPFGARLAARSIRFTRVERPNQCSLA